MSDEARAVVAVAETTNNFINKSAEVSHFIGRVFGPAIEDIGAIAAQYTEYWKIRNALRLRDKLEEVIIERGHPELSELPLRIGLPLLDAALNEDDDTIQKLWANLLASAMTENDVVSVIKPFVEVLKQLDVADAEILNAYFRNQFKKNALNTPLFINDSGKHSPAEISLSLNNLERLGLIKFYDENTSNHDEMIFRVWYIGGEDKSFPSFTVAVSLTIFGYYFMSACTDGKIVRMKDGGPFTPTDLRLRDTPYTLYDKS